MYIGSWDDSDTITFSVLTKGANGAVADADAVPAYRIYEDETATPIHTGNMAKLDDSNTLGLYSERIQIALVKGKSYSIYVSYAISAVAYGELHNIQMSAAADLRHINGAATDGYNATLSLKSLMVVNDAGDAVYVQSQGGNGHGISAGGHGTGHGVFGYGGATAGCGAYLVGGDGGISGSLAGCGLKLQGSVTANAGAGASGSNEGAGLSIISISQIAPAVHIEGKQSTFGSGIYIITAGNGIGCLVNGSGGGSAVDLRGGLLSDAAFICRAGVGSDGDGAKFIGDGDGSGVEMTNTDPTGMALMLEDSVGGVNFKNVFITEASRVDSVYSTTNSTLSELSAGKPSDTPTLSQLLMFLYMQQKNKITTTLTLQKLYAANGTTEICKNALDDNGTTFTRSPSVAP
jgi:hypothetical protein